MNTTIHQEKNPQEKGYFRDLRVDGRVIPNKYCTWLIWLAVGTKGGILWRGYWNFEPRKKPGVCVDDTISFSRHVLFRYELRVPKIWDMGIEVVHFGKTARYFSTAKLYE
jgi:hypothetical protein